LPGQGSMPGSLGSSSLTNYLIDSSISCIASRLVIASPLERSNDGILRY
jgi:hypothetical protein